MPDVIVDYPLISRLWPRYQSGFRYKSDCLLRVRVDGCARHQLTMLHKDYRGKMRERQQIYTYKENECAIPDLLFPTQLTATKEPYELTRSVDHCDSANAIVIDDLIRALDRRVLRHE
jgi:hypothetical protein